MKGLQALEITFLPMFSHKKELFELRLKDFMLILLATIISFSAYAVIIWSMKIIPIAFVL